MIEALLLTASLFCVEPEVPSATEVESVLETGWPSESVYGTTAPYDFLTPTEPSEDGTLSYRIYVDPLYESYGPCFDEIVTDILHDHRGWGNMRRAGPGENPQMWIILAPPGSTHCVRQGTVYRSCSTFGHGPISINALRWMNGYEVFDSLDDSRTYLVTHEIGHVFGHRHTEGTVMGVDRIKHRPPLWPIRMTVDTRL